VEPCSGGAGKHRAEVAGCAAENEQVPDKVIVAGVFPHKEDDSRGIGETAGNQPEDSGEGDYRRKFAYKDQA